MANQPNLNPYNTLFVAPFHAPMVDPATGKLTPTWQAVWSNQLIPALKGLSGSTGSGGGGGTGATGMTGATGPQGIPGAEGGSAGASYPVWDMYQDVLVSASSCYVICEPLVTNGYALSLGYEAVLGVV